MNEPVECIPAAPEPGSRVCPYCEATFIPKRSWQLFCSRTHRAAFDKDFGTAGKVASVRRLRRGVSITIHLSEGPAAQRALNMGVGEAVRLVAAKRSDEG